MKKDVVGLPRVNTARRTTTRNSHTTSLPASQPTTQSYTHPPTHPSSQPASPPVSRPCLHPFVRPRNSRSGSLHPSHPRPRRRPRRCRLFVTIGQKFHCNRYATHRHHRLPLPLRCSAQMTDKHPTTQPPNEPSSHLACHPIQHIQLNDRATVTTDSTQHQHPHPHPPSQPASRAGQATTQPPTARTDSQPATLSASASASA